MNLNIRLLTPALTVAFVLLIPQAAGAQSLGAVESNTYLDGTRLTYYQRPSLDQCQADCANNADCKGFTWIQAGTYNPRDAAMCYLLSAVTGRSSARGHFSAVKGAAGGGSGGGGCRGTSYSVTVNPTTISQGEKVNAQVASPDGKYPERAWVGVFPEGGSGHLGQWSYMSDLPSCGRAFTPPGPGRYEVRLLLKSDG